MVRLLEGYGEHPHTEKQQKIVELLEQVGCASVRELCYFTGVTRAVVDRMRKSGMVELYEELTPRRASSRTAGPTDTEPIRLSPSQQAAFDLLLEVGRSPKAEVSLLHGVTGSGKTQVFLRLIEETLSRGRTALVLIPEISLTPQTVSKFSARFGSLVAVLHSSLSMTERFDEWQRIRSGAARIVVGTRSGGHGAAGKHRPHCDRRGAGTYLPFGKPLRATMPATLPSTGRCGIVRICMLCSGRTQRWYFPERAVINSFQSMG